MGGGRPDVRGYCQLDARSAQLPQVLLSCQSRSAYQGSTSRIAPSDEGMITRSTMLTGGEAMAAELEVVVDRRMSGEKLLGLPG